MKLIESIKQSLAPTSKALQPQQTDSMMEQLLSLLRGRTPIMMSDRSEAYIQDGYTSNPDVYSVITGITSAASAVPPIVYEIKNSQKAREYNRLKSMQRAGAEFSVVRRAQKLKEEAFEEAPESDLAKLIDRPNPLQAWPEFLENILGFKLITGNTFIHGNLLSDGRFAELWPMPPQLTRIIADKGTESIVEGYVLNFYGKEHIIPAETVLHHKMWNPNYSYSGAQLYGMSPLKAAARTIQSSNDSLKTMVSSLQNQGASGFIYPKEGQPLSEKQKDQMERFFQQRGGRPENAKKVLALSTEFGWQNLGLSPVDLEIIESRKMSMRDLCNIYQYPSELLNDPDNKTNTNKRESRKQLYQEVVIPTLERFYSELNRWLQPRFGQQFFVDYDDSQLDALTEDIGNKVEWLEKAWWIAPNEKAKEMNFDPIDDPRFDEPWIPMNKIPLSKLEADIELTDEESKLLQLEYQNSGNA
mgnify:CR=1 FL=1